MPIQPIAICLWEVFCVYWLVMARVTAPAPQRHEPELVGQSRPVRGISFAVNILAYLLIFAHLDHRWPWQRLYPANQVADVVYLLVLVCALLLAIWARVVLGKNWSGDVRQVRGQALIQTGPYHALRHPIYAGILLGFLATSLLLGTPAAFTGFVLLASSFAIKLRAEERLLLRIFGEAYREYRQQSWALIPYVY